MLQHGTMTGCCLRSSVYGDRQTHHTSPNEARVVSRGSIHVLFCSAIEKMCSCSAMTKETDTREAISQSLTPHFKNEPLCSHPVRLFAHHRSDSSQSIRNVSLLLCSASHPLFCCNDSGNESLLHSGLLHISKHTSTLSVACGEHRASEV